jgi:hypothetical protein
MQQISLQRWNALASYCRLPGAEILFQELAWFESNEHQVLAMVAADTESDFLTAFFARDKIQRFRLVWVSGPYESFNVAASNLTEVLQQISPKIDALRIQGNESGRVTDLFAQRAPDTKLNPRFRRLADEEDYSAAKSLVRELMHWHEDVDGNFVEQFQTTGFDARMWELYLFATLAEAGLQVEHPRPAPDILAKGIHGEFTIEATTINPTTGSSDTPPIPTNAADMAAYIRHYLPIRYAGPLTTKLAKKYWTRDAARGKPLVLAIQDFHAPLSMTYSYPALPMYLYGVTHTPHRDSARRLIIEATPIANHRWGTKDVPSGFFSLPDAENVSAVVFNNSGTLNKFNRMGVGAGFGAANITLIRRGTLWDPNPDSSTPTPFEEVIGEGNPETWVEGMDVFHNPNALYPFDTEHLAGAAHHRIRPDLQIETFCRGRKPMTSGTEIRRSEAVEK